MGTLGEGGQQGGGAAMAWAGRERGGDVLGVEVDVDMDLCAQITAEYAKGSQEAMEEGREAHDDDADDVMEDSDF